MFLIWPSSDHTTEHTSDDNTEDIILQQGVFVSVSRKGEYPDSKIILKVRSLVSMVSMSMGVFDFFGLGLTFCK